MSSEPVEFVEKRPLGLLLKHIVRKVFLEDWMIKLVALVVTFALWLGVTGLSTPTTTRFSNVPLTLRFSNSTEITNTPIQEIDIVVSGDRRRINQINKNDLIASVDLTDTPPGDLVLTLTPDKVSIDLPTGIKLDEIQPARIAVRLEAVEEKEVPVKVETAGTIEDGYEIYNSLPAPQRVRVRGPVSIMKSLSVVSTEKVDVTGRNGDFISNDVPINVASLKVSLLEATVNVSFRIGERRIERTFNVAVDGEARRRATVVLFGPRSVVSGLSSQDLSVELNKSETGSDTPRLNLPIQAQGIVEIRRLKLI